MRIRVFGKYNKKKLLSSELKYGSFEYDSSVEKQYILGVATGKYLNYTKLFMSSARNCHPDADIVIFTDPEVSKEILAFSQEQEVTLLPIDKNSITNSYHIQNSRYIEYLNFVLATPKNSLYFLSDTRDVFFQRNIFTSFKDESDGNEDLQVFEESNATPLGECGYNGLWVERMFGQETMKRLADKTILCSGTTLGNWQGMVEYFSLMISLIQAYPALRFDISDQGAHNVIIRDQLLRSSVQIHSQENELVRTPI